MRDLIDHHAREMMLDLTGERRPVPEMGRAGPAEPAEGGSDGPATSVWSGNRNAAHGASTRSGAMRAGIRHHIVMDDATADALWLAARMAVGAVYDQALALMAEAVEDGQDVGLAGAEPWTEGDGAYWDRLRKNTSFAELCVQFGSLDAIGRHLDLPRARLVPVEG